MISTNLLKLLIICIVLSYLNYILIMENLSLIYDLSDVIVQSQFSAKLGICCPFLFATTCDTYIQVHEYSSQIG